MPRTHAVESAYLKRAALLIDAARRQGLDAPQWLIQQAPHLRPSTLRQYRASLYFWAMSTGQGQVAAMVAAVGRGVAGPRDLPRRTSAAKRKSLPDSEMARLAQALAGPPGSRAQQAYAVLVASRATGLRPCEWYGARRHGLELCVFNAKATNGRSHGVKRTLVLADDQESIGAIDAVIAAANAGTKQDWARKAASSAKALQRANRATVKSGRPAPTQYSARHQYTADLKRVASKVEVAAALGHATDETAGRHYARSHKGRTGARLAMPLADEAQRVKIIRREPAARVSMQTPEVKK